MPLLVMILRKDKNIKDKNNNDSKYNNYNLRRSIKQKRNINWFNLPFSKIIVTKIARYFLNEIENHFPHDHKFHKMSSKNNLKVSYICMPNI